MRQLKSAGKGVGESWGNVRSDGESNRRRAAKAIDHNMEFRWS